MPAIAKLYLPAVKSLSRILAVVAMNEPTLTLPATPMLMPAALLMATVPRALMLPLITEAPPPITRFSADQLLLSWEKTIDSPAAMLKVFQLMTTLAVDWMTSISLALTMICAWPEVTVPPWGRAHAVPVASVGNTTTTLHNAVVSLRPRMSPVSAGQGRATRLPESSAATGHPRGQGDDFAWVERLRRPLVFAVLILLAIACPQSHRRTRSECVADAVLGRRNY